MMRLRGVRDDKIEGGSSWMAKLMRRVADSEIGGVGRR